MSSHYYDFDQRDLEVKELKELELKDILELYSTKVRTEGRFVVWMKSEKKHGAEWGNVSGIEVVSDDVSEFKNSLTFATSASKL